MKRKTTLILLAVSVTVILTISLVFLLITLFKFGAKTDDILSVDSALVSSESITETIAPENSSDTDASSLSSVTVPQDNGIHLVMTSPTTNKVTTTEAVFTFKGTSDPEKPLTVNGVTLNRTASGEFTYTANLKTGDNKFNFAHKGKNYYYTVNYRYVIINY